MYSGIENWILKRCGLASFQDLEDWQQDQLARQTDYAKRSLFYRNRLRGFTTSDDLRSNPLQFLCIPPKEVSRITTLPTSGTSGVSKRVFFSEEDLQLTVEYFHVGMQELMAPQQKAAIFMPGATPGSVGDLLIQAIEGFGGEAAAYGFIRNPYDAQIQAADADCLLGHPIQLLTLSRIAPHLRPKSVLLTGDPVPAWLITEMEQTWSCRIHPHYGLTESGFGLAVRGKDGYGEQICHPFIRLDIMDPQTGTLVPDGEWGEIVLSTLMRQAMPLLHYRTGDCGRWLPDTYPKRLDIRQSRIQQPQLERNFTIHHLDQAVFSIKDVFYYTATLKKEGLLLTIDSPAEYHDISVALKKVLHLSIPWRIEKKKMLCEPGKRKIAKEE